METEKEIKKEFKLKAQGEPEKYYPVSILKERGFKRQQCRVCGTFFWSIKERGTCGDAACIGRYEFIGNSPAKRKLSYIQVWKEFAKLFESFDYTPIKRYPVVARWRDDAYFVQASIYDFQPYCVRGEVDPPANPLVVPQFCLRFNDIDNVGITGRHFTGFVMIGQHAFEKKKNYKPEPYLEHIYEWLTKGMRIPEEEIQFHEDAWAGGGNLGPSMEFFSGGLEIGNQVYMQYEISSNGIKELEIKVLDMGMGQERPAWLTQAVSTSYDAVFGDVMDKLYRKANINIDRDFLKNFLPLSGILNFEEEDYNKSMQKIANAMETSVEEIESKIIPLSRLYSIAEHARSLLVAISDGALPSNVGGGYNLRTILRRALNFIELENWELSLYEICEMHARYLREQFPELLENIEELKEILEIEEKRYVETRKKSRKIIISLKEKGEKLSIEKLFELYDSQGISPEMLKQSGIGIEIPHDFYARISEMHEEKRRKARINAKREEEEIDRLNSELKSIDTVKLYYLDSELFEFDAKVVKSVNSYVILDKTAFYPLGGGQEYDTGVIRSEDNKKHANVIAVYKKENAVLHKLDNNPFKEGDAVKCKVNRKRRKQLTKHHTATHIINGAAKALLGEHIWQSGAEKTEEKARLDITHYENLSLEQIEKLEELANSIVERGERIEAEFYSRDEAEKRFGFRIYQGGAVPGKTLRIVRIGSDIDTEACGGTHLKNTREAEIVRIMSSTRIQDGIVRLEFCAGEACIKFIENEIEILKKVKESAETITKVETDLIAFAEKELEVQKKEKVVNKKRLKVFQRLSREIKACCDVFSVSKSELESTVKRFVKELLSLIEENKKLGGKAWKEIEKEKKEKVSIANACRKIFGYWKKILKENESLKKIEIGEKAEKKFEEINGLRFAFIKADNIAKGFSNIARSFSGEHDVLIILSRESSGIAFAISVKNNELDARKIFSLIAAEIKAKGGGKKDFVQGFIFEERFEEIDERIKKALKKLS